jgi:uncharacterized RDD family membrane protein YckC
MANPYAPPQAVVTDVVRAAGIVPADRGTRLGAAFLDGAIIAAMVALPAVIALLVTGVASGGRDAATEWVILVSLMPTLIGMVVWAWLTVKFVRGNGQTIAKKILGIKVVRRDGSPASLGRIFWLRNIVNSLASAIPLLGAFYGLIDVAFIFGESRQCLHDKIADTIVVRA